MNISILQFDVKWLSFEHNLATISNHLDSLGAPIDLLILPEMFLTGFSVDAKPAGLEENNECISELIGLCSKHDTAIIGSLAIKANNEYYNRVLFMTSNGIEARYDKQHLFSPAGESEEYSIEYPNVLINYKGWKIMPQVCYDLRFPENVRNHETPDLLIYMANWPESRIDHWNTLLAARAIENQCFTIGCNRLGKDSNDWCYNGHSQIVKPDGKVISLVDNPESLEVELPLSTVENYRSKYRFLEDKKSSK